MTPDAPATPPLPRIVLDTNILLDWRVFKDPLVQPVTQAIVEGRMRWLCTVRMQEEWHHVWPRSVFAAWRPDALYAHSVFEHACMTEEPPRGPLRCKDPDDQVFIDLALHHGAQWLLTKDKALLKLARRARALGCEVLRPEEAGSAFRAAPAPL